MPLMNNREKIETLISGINALPYVTGGVSVQPDWNENDSKNPAHIRNRTHYNVPPAFDIQWDGVVGDRFALDMTAFGYEGVSYVKVDDRTLTIEDMCGAEIWTSFEDSLDAVHPETCNSYLYPGIYSVNSMIIVVYAQEKINAALGLPDGMITNGIYFYLYAEDDFFVTRFVGKDNTKKLDTKYLPYGYPHESEPKFNIIWDGNMEGRATLDMTTLEAPGFYFVKVSDEVISEEDAIGASYAWCDGNVNEGIAEYEIDSSTYPGAYHINSEIVVLHDESQLNAALGLPDGYLTNGVYFLAHPEDQCYVTRFTGKITVTPMDPRYLAGLATVAKSGNYYDLHSRPIVYTDVVRYASGQGLSSTNKANARTNIDVYSKSEVDNLIRDEVGEAIYIAITGAIGGSY